MKVLVAMLGIILFAGIVHAEGDIVLKSEKERLSYSIGLDIGNSLKSQSLDVDADILSKGINDVLSGNKPLLSEQEFRDTMTNFRKEMMAKQANRMKEAGENNSKTGEAFLAENKKKEGIVTLPSGLQYKVIKEGKGDTPGPEDEVTVNYKGSLIDGTEFDNSYKRGQPASFKVNGVITGWTEALQLMKTGAKWELYIPSKLAYGERSSGRQIGPNSTLIFEVELISVN